MRGDHGCQTRARFSFGTGPPVQPHADYESEDITSRLAYCPLPPPLLKLLDLQDIMRTPESAAAHFKSGELDGLDDENSAVFSQEGYFPNAKGWSYELPDGVVTRLRYASSREANTPVAEWSCAVRVIVIPHDLNFEVAAGRLCDNFE